MPLIAELCPDKMALPKIRFKRRVFVFVGEGQPALGKSGTIAFEKAYRTGRPSFAHLMKDGSIMRYQKQIGTINDLEMLTEGE